MPNFRLNVNLRSATLIAKLNNDRFKLVSIKKVIIITGTKLVLSPQMLRRRYIKIFRTKQD